MFAQGFNLLRYGQRRRWSAAVVSAALVWSGPNAVAQSMLRFVGPDDSEPKATVSLPQPTVAAAPVALPRGSEFRLVDVTEGMATPLPQLSVSSQDVKTSGHSTLKFAPTVPAGLQSMSGATAPAVDSYDLRFRPESQVQPQQRGTATFTESSGAITSAPTVVIMQQASQAVRPQTAVSSPSAPPPIAAELFAKPVTSNAAQPRIEMVLEHIPALAPQHVDAEPVRSARELAPTYTVPAGTELFVTGAPDLVKSVPSVPTATAQPWNLPAMDYGAALRQVQPDLTAVTRAKPIEPQRVVARELPQSATEMFGVAAAGPLLTQPAPPRPAPSLQSASEPLPAPSYAQTTRPAAQTIDPVPPEPLPKQPAVIASPRGVAATTPMHKSTVAFTKPTAAATELVEPPLPTPRTGPTRVAQVATPAASPPPASELEFNRVASVVESRLPQFTSSAPAQAASSLSAVAKDSQHELVPAKVETAPPIAVGQSNAVSQSKLPFEYQPGELAKDSHVPQYKPAPVDAPVISAPEQGQVIATVDPQNPNTYTLSLATANGAPPAMYVNRLEPVSTGAAGVGPEATPSALPAACNCNAGAYGQHGCPYLPGQSGTRALCGVDCGRCGSSCCSTWDDATCIPWALLGPGEYVGPARPAHVETYYLRVNDLITLTFIESRKKSAEHYRIGVGDQLQIEWLQGATSTEKALDRNLLVQPDGTVTLPLIGEVTAAGKTVNDFRDEVVKLYSKFQRDPQITVTPLTVNVAVQDILKAVTSKNASSGQTQDVRVTPEGTIQAAGIGSVYVQGLTLDELRSELEARYAESFGPGLAVSPQLTERATSYVFMGGEVRSPGRYVLEGPTTVMQAISQAGGWNIGGDLHQVVIFRRDENWCLKATKIDIRAPLYGKDPCPTNDVWLRDNDLVIVPKSCILCATDMINLYFTRGIYSVFPVTYVYDLSQNTGIVPVP